MEAKIYHPVTAVVQAGRSVYDGCLRLMETYGLLVYRPIIINCMEC